MNSRTIIRKLQASRMATGSSRRAVTISFVHPDIPTGRDGASSTQGRADRHHQEHRATVWRQAQVGGQPLTIYIASPAQGSRQRLRSRFPGFPRLHHRRQHARGNPRNGCRRRSSSTSRCMLEHGQPIPEPSSLDDVMADPENAEAIPFLVAVPDRLPGQGVHVDLTIPAAGSRKARRSCQEARPARARPF